MVEGTIGQLIYKSFFSFLSSFLLTSVIIYYVRLYAYKVHFVDKPDGVLKKHSAPIPYCGGISIFLGVFLIAFVVMPWNKAFISLFGISLLAVLFGIIDDWRRIAPVTKLLFQMIIALLCVCTYFVLPASNIFLYGASFLWYLLVMNGFNLIDIMDGLLGVCLFWISFFYFLLTLKLVLYWAIFLAIINGAILAFLWYNFPPATIYMGEAGSLAMGVILGSMPFFMIKSTHLVSYMHILLLGSLFLIPLYELCNLIIIRSWNRIPFYQGSPHHFALYLQSYGLKKREILFLITCFSIMLGGLVLWFLK